MNIIFIAIFIALGLFMFYVDRSNKIAKGESVNYSKRMVINNARKVDQQINNAETMTVNNYNRSTVNIRPQNTPAYQLTSEDEALLANALNKYNIKSTTTTASQSIDNDTSTTDNIGYLTPQHKVVDDNFLEILKRIDEGQKYSRIIREMFNVSGGDLFLKYMKAIKYYTNENEAV